MASSLSSRREKENGLGIAELWQWLYEKQQTSGHDSRGLLAGIWITASGMSWALGRSTLDYQSALPTSTMYVGDTRPETKVIGDSFSPGVPRCVPALAFAEKNDMIIYGRLGMNRHYGDSLGGALRSQYIAAHPEWMERHRGGQVDGTKVSFAIPEYRAERIAVLMEVAQIGAHGLCLDFCRQPPVARYHPQRSRSVAEGRSR